MLEWHYAAQAKRACTDRVAASHLRALSEGKELAALLGDCLLHQDILSCMQDVYKVGINIGECRNLELRGPATAYVALDALPWVQGTIANISWNGSDTVGPYRWDVQAGGLTSFSHYPLKQTACLSALTLISIFSHTLHHLVCVWPTRPHMRLCSAGCLTLVLEASLH